MLNHNNNKDIMYRIRKGSDITGFKILGYKDLNSWSVNSRFGVIS